MKLVTISWLIIAPLLLIKGAPCLSQIVTGQTPDIEFQQNKGIIAFTSARPGAIFFNDYFLTRSKGGDTIYFLNLKPATYKITFVNGSDTLKGLVPVSGRKVSLLRPAENYFLVSDDSMKYYATTDKIAGKPRFYFRNGHGYLLFQATVVSGFGSFNTFSLIAGFQASPGFSFGGGLGYNNYDLTSQAISSNTIQNVSLMPLFADIRFHFSNKQVMPFIYVNLGHTLVLDHQSESFQMDYWSTYDHCTEVISAGGIHFATGLGLRVGITQRFQLTASLDYCNERLRHRIDYIYNDVVMAEHIMIQKINMVRFNVGLVFQY